MAPGVRACVRAKIDGNEDALGWIKNDSLELLLAADSHYGAHAGVWAVSRFWAHFSRMTGPLARRLFLAHLAIHEDIRAESRRRGPRMHPHCATTLVSAALHGCDIAYCSTGDSSLFLADSEGVRDWAEPSGVFLGDPFQHPLQATRFLEELGCLDPLADAGTVGAVLYELGRLARVAASGRLDGDAVRTGVAAMEEAAGRPLGIAREEMAAPWAPIYGVALRTLPVFGSRRLRPGDRLLLATDGIEPDKCGLPRKALHEILVDDRLDARARMEKLLKKSTGRQGGKDNLAMLLAEGF